VYLSIDEESKRKTEMKMVSRIKTINVLISPVSQSSVAVLTRTMMEYRIKKINVPARQD